jgi:hypothetical protein
LDLLYSDPHNRAGVRGEEHARLLFRQWLEIFCRHCRVSDTERAYLLCVVPLYGPPGFEAPPPGRLLSRREAGAAMRAPLEEVTRAFLRHVYNPQRQPGIRDEVHAKECFRIFSQLYAQALSGGIQRAAR